MQSKNKNNMQNAEYEIQHFGFSVEQMKLERRHVIKQHLSSLLKLLVNSLVKKSNVSAETASKIIESQKNVAEKMFDSFEKTLEGIEKLDEQNFSIPENVLLDQDFGHMKECTQEEETSLQTEVENLRKQFLENSVMISAIEAENSKYEDVQTLIQEELKAFNVVQESFTAINIQNSRQMVKSVWETLEKSNM